MQANYPTKQELKKIEEWEGFDHEAMLEFVKSLWMFPEYFSKNGNKYNISTAGWSGNESIIYAMEKNTLFWISCWMESRRGGHYKFEIPKFKKDNKHEKK